MKRRELTGWEKCLFLVPFLSLLLLPLIGNEPLSWRFSALDARGKARSSSCQNNLKQLEIGMLQYSKDYDEKFPPAKIGGVRPAFPASSWTLKPPVGWVDALYPYTKSSTLNFCPATPIAAWNGPNSPHATHSWFNGNLSALSRLKINRPAATLMLGDGNDGKEVADGTYSKTSLPSHWLNDYNAPCYRHLGGANYGFADGHAKWLSPKEISAAPGAAYTFATR